MFVNHEIKVSKFCQVFEVGLRLSVKYVYAPLQINNIYIYIYMYM